MATSDIDNQAGQTVDKSTKTKSKPKKVLPTDRVAVLRQFEILRGYAAASGVDHKPVSNEDVGKVVNIHSGSVSICNPLFLDLGLISREKNGNVPAEEVFAFAERSQWNPEKAALKLAPLVRKSWFAASLLPKLAFRPLSIDQAIEFLADEAAAGPEYKDHLAALIEYLKMTGIVSIEGTTITLVKAAEENGSANGASGGANDSESSVKESTAKESGTRVASQLEANYHPFIAGLLKTLPDPESSWPIAGRVKWLQAASNIFDLIYTTNDTEAGDYIEVKRNSIV